MNLPFSLRQKVNIAVVLFTVMVCTILINVLAEKSVSNMNNTIASIYNDRLVPATDLFEIATRVHEKTQLIDSIEREEVAFGALEQYKTRLKEFDLKIKLLVNKYERTYLVAEEKEGLKELNSELSKVNALQEKLLQTQKQFLFKPLKDELFEVSSAVAKLSRIQLVVGKELIAKSQGSNTNAKIYSTAQFAISLLIGILILSILLTPSLLKVKSDQFSLN